MTPRTRNRCHRVTVVGMTVGRRPQRRFKLRRLKFVRKISPLSSRADDGIGPQEASAGEKPTEISLSSQSDQSSENDNVLPSKLRDVCLNAASLRTISLSHGFVSVIGRRREMEDAVTVELKFLDGRYDFFGVYDGHGGPQVAQACARRLHEVVVDRAMAGAGDQVETIGWEEVMVGSFERMDREVVMDGSMAEEVARMVGSTAVVAVVGKDEVVVANCGDSRAVLWRGDEAVALSNDHKVYTAVTRYGKLLITYLEHGRLTRHPTECMCCDSLDDPMS